MNESMFSLLDVISLAIGVYTFYACFLMKTTGELKTKLMLSDKMDINKCKDKEGFSNYMFPKLIIMGVLAVIYGAAGLIHSYVTPISYVQFIVMIIFIIYLFWYSYITRKAVKLFWQI